MKRIFHLLCLILFSSTFLNGQLLLTAKADKTAVSEEKLAQIDTYIQKYISDGVVPGGTFLIARGGQIVYNKSFGISNISTGKKYANDDIYRLASMTKAVTTVAIMQLYEQGKLGLDDPIFYYLPEFKEKTILDKYNDADSSYTTIPAKRPITIRHLLTHTSGITYGDFNTGGLRQIYADHDLLGVGLYHEKWNNEQFIKKLAEVPLAFEPGTKFLYGLNMDVLGRIVELVSGEELDDYFTRHIFNPLGMTDTYFNIPPSKKDRLVPVYSVDDKGKIITVQPGGLAGNPDYPLLADNHHYAGGGGLSGTATDYAKFIYALENNGKYNGYQLLSRKTIEVMTSDQLIMQNKVGNGIAPIPGVTFGLGFLLYEHEAEGLNSKSAGTYEWGGYFNTKFFIDPKEDLVFVGMTQIVPFNRDDFWDRLYAIIYSALE